MNSFESCTICFQIIIPNDKVEILLKNIHCKTILSKYVWHKSPYCFNCFQIGRKLLWQHFISLLLTSDQICAVNMLASLKYYDFPLRLTNNMHINGTPIYALYYHNQMSTSKLETGLNEFRLEIFKDKIKKAKTILELEIAKGINTNTTINTALNDLFQNMKVC